MNSHPLLGENPRLERDEGMFETIFLSVIILVLAILAVMELSYCRSQKVAGWEAVYFSRRLKRRLLGLALLIVISISIFFGSRVRLFFHGPLWNLVYLLGSLALAFVVFLLLVRDIMETARYAVRKHSEITSQSLRHFPENPGVKSPLKDGNKEA